MSTDGMDPGSVWHDPRDSHREQPFNQSQAAQQGQDDSFAGTQQQGMMPAGDAGGGEYEDEYSGNYGDGQPEQGAPRGHLLQHFGQYVTLILAPLLFAGLTALFVLPLIAANRAQIPPAGLVPVALVILLIAIVQGVAVYYAGSDNGLWALGTLGGFFLFVLVGCFTIFGLLTGFIALLAIIVLTVVLARLYIHPVVEGFVDIVYAFGKYSRTLYPGPNILLPWEKVVQSLRVEETQWICPAQRVQLSREEDVILRAAISYQVLPEDAYLTATQVNRWEESLREFFIACVQNIAGTFSPDDFIAMPEGMHATPTQQERERRAHWDQINAYLFQQIRDKVALWGVQINWVRLRDVELVPHGAYVMDAPPVVNAQPAARAAGAAPTQAKASQGHTEIVEAAAPHPGRPGTAAPPEQPKTGTPPVRLPSEEVLIKAYQEVQKEKITDPETIRSIADKFKQVADDPEASQTVSFDAARAALNLYEQARRIEERYKAEPAYEDDTKPDWTVRRPTDENLMAGG